MNAVGIDIGGTRIKAVRLDASGTVLGSAQRDTSDERGALVEQVKALLADLGTERGEPIGIASPGLAGRDNRAIQWMRGRLDCVEGLDWTQQLARPAVVVNDAHAATLGEARLGAAAGKAHVVMLTLGTGVGGGVLVEGRLLQGAIGRAGHLGHISLDAQGEPDIVNTPGSLEDLVGAHSLAAQSEGRFHEIAELSAAVERGDAAARELWDRRVDALAAGIVSLINAFDPEVVILGGGVAAAGATLFEPLRERLNQWEWRPLGAPVPVVPAALGEQAGAIGAARFASEQAGSVRE